MSMTRHPLRSTSLRRRLGLVGLTVAALAGASACQPAPQVLTDAPGEVAVTVTYAGQPVDAHLSLMKAGQSESAQTGSDGAVTLSLAPGTWTVDASATGDPLAEDPLCFQTLASDPDPHVTVVSEQTASLVIELEAAPIACA